MDDSSLKSIRVSSIKTKKQLILDPKFDPKIFEYDIIVNTDETEVQLHFACSQEDSFARVVGADAGKIILKFRINEVGIEVEAPDGSKSKYKIRVLRPEGNDTTISEFLLSDSALQITPPFSVQERVYFVDVPDDYTTLDLKIKTTNPQATVKMVPDDPRITSSEKVFIVEVTSFDKTACEETKLFIRKQRSPFPINSPNHSWCCQLCSCLIFQPRTCSSCSLSFCRQCSMFWSPNHSCRCIKCDQIIDFDSKLEDLISQASVSCPYSKAGCIEKGTLSDIRKHALTCSVYPKSCERCFDFVEMTNPHSNCSSSCKSCGKQTIASDNSELHEKYCSVAFDIKSLFSIHKKDVEQIESRIRTSCRQFTKAEVEKRLKQYRLSAKGFFLQDIKSIEVAESLEKELIELLSWYIEQLEVKSNEKELVLEYCHILNELWAIKNCFQRRNSTYPVDLDKADNSLMDEVNGLLMFLDVAKGATIGEKIKAMEAEYHRVKDLGQVNQASEIQGLIAYFLKENQKGLKIDNCIREEISELQLSQHRLAQVMGENIQIIHVILKQQMLLGNSHSIEFSKLVQYSLAVKPTDKFSRAMYFISLLGENNIKQVNYDIKKAIKKVEYYVYSLFRNEKISEFSLFESLFEKQERIIALDSIRNGYCFIGNHFEAVMTGFQCTYYFPEFLLCLEKTSNVTLDKYYQLLKLTKDNLQACKSLAKPEILQLALSCSQNVLKLIDKLEIESLNSVQKASFTNLCLELLERLLLVEFNAKNIADCGFGALRCFDVNNKIEYLAQAGDCFSAAIQLETSSADVVKAALEPKPWWKESKPKGIEPQISTVKKDKVQGQSQVSKTKPGVQPNTKPMGAKSVTTPATAKKPTAAISAPAKASSKATSSATIPKKQPAKPNTKESPATNSGTASVETKPVKKDHLARFGLAMMQKKLMQNSDKLNSAKDTPTTEDTVKILKECISIDPKYHDAYIECASLLISEKRIDDALDIYCAFPFTNNPSRDDLFIHSEIVRLFLQQKKLKNPALKRSIIAEGKMNGIKSISNYVEILDAASEHETLMDIFCEVNSKPRDDVFHVNTARNARLFQGQVLVIKPWNLPANCAANLGLMPTFCIKF